MFLGNYKLPLLIKLILKGQNWNQWINIAGRKTVNNFIRNSFLSKIMVQDGKKNYIDMSVTERNVKPSYQNA